MYMGQRFKILSPEKRAMAFFLALSCGQAASAGNEMPPVAPTERLSCPTTNTINCAYATIKVTAIPRNKT